MKKRYIILIVGLSFVLGLVMAKPFSGLSIMFKSEKNIQCATENICVGQPVSNVFGLYESDSLGGLDALICGSTKGSGNSDYLFIRDIVAGKSCQNENYYLIYATEHTRTLIQVRSDKIAAIRQGPRHSLDL